MSTIKTALHSDAMRKDIRELVAELLATIGTTAVQAMTATKNRSTPLSWTKDNKPRPRPATETQLRLGFRVVTIVRDSDGLSVASAWMSGANPRLGEDTPITAIREGRAAEVVAAAEAFASDVHG